MLIILIIIGSAIVLFQDWGPLVLLKGIVSFSVIYLLRKQIVYAYSKFMKFLEYLAENKNKKQQPKKKNVFK